MHASRSALLSVVFIAALGSVSFAGLKEGIDAYQERRYGEALKEFRPLADENDPEAQFYLGVMYAKGRGVPQDYQESVHWYQHAAEQGFPKAMSNLAAMYSKGKGVPKDYAQAIRWYQRAAEEQLPEAQYNLGVMYKEGQGVARDLVRAHMWFNLAAGRGHEDAYRARVLVARMMKPEEIAEAQKLARQWREKKDCSNPDTLDALPCP
jgi:TPR repeat protein